VTAAGATRSRVARERPSLRCGAESQRALPTIDSLVDRGGCECGPIANSLRSRVSARVRALGRPIDRDGRRTSRAVIDLAAPRLIAWISFDPRAAARVGCLPRFTALNASPLHRPTQPFAGWGVFHG
jgi:hypothetical protein